MATEMTIAATIEAIEQQRDSRVLVLAASQLEIELLGPVFDALSEVGPCRRLDVLFYSRGGLVNAARRIALLLREFSEQVNFLVPHYCESAGTITALSADQILAGPLAIFSPVDPLLSAAAGGGESGPLALSAQDLRQFHQMSVDWFGIEPQHAKAQALALFGDQIFPATLTSFYRSTLEVQSICQELLALNRDPHGSERRQQIADQLIFGYHSHTYALTRDDLAALGLPMTRDAAIESLMWPAARTLRANVGPGARITSEDAWTDALIATRHGAVVRRHSEDLPGRWEAWSPA